ncbi:hypothetical protein ENSA5_07290 [Enhygromyxa salina]|uniref:Uncharacterized protein n=1 Tax=Enhygromyxa salina TaxID=215803 RepID=A0A2S9YHB2_9BACT|nr:hypothetical protein ENSA5_07290 [Enhygromyxa salina]
MFESTDRVSCEIATFGQLFLREPPDLAESFDVGPK